MSLNPLSWINLAGTWSVVGVSLSLPVETVRWMLPAGAELGPQPYTPQGEHPVVLYFGSLFGAHLTFPRVLINNVNYREQIVGIPYVYTRGRSGPVGPYFFMPQLYLNDALFTLGGRLVWGFAKNLARIVETPVDGKPDALRYAVQTVRGRLPVIEAEWTPQGPAEPVLNNPLFKAQLAIMRQPLLAQKPLLFNSYFTCSDFSKSWPGATVRPVAAESLVQAEFVAGLPTGKRVYTPLDASNPLGAFHLRAQWNLDLPSVCGWSP